MHCVFLYFNRPYRWSIKLVLDVLIICTSLINDKGFKQKIILFSHWNIHILLEFNVYNLQHTLRSSYHCNTPEINHFLVGSSEVVTSVKCPFQVWPRKGNHDMSILSTHLWSKLQASPYVFVFFSFLDTLCSGAIEAK